MDENTFKGRVKRYTRVGYAASKAAGKYAGLRVLGLPFSKSDHADELRRALGGLKGPVMKLAQILATVPDALPAEYTQELAQLQADAPAMGWPFVKRRMKTELGSEWLDLFSSFEKTASFAASLGQVHRAEDHDGSILACKLQYPDMASAVEADLRQLKIIFALYRRYDQAIDPTQIHQELSERLREELDYDREARHMKLYGHMLKNEDHIHIPIPKAELSTSRLLCMTWLEGKPLLEFAQDNREFRDQLALNMFRAWYTPLYRYGVIHGDPHLGNYTVCPDGSLNLLDFGCVRVFKPDFVKGIIDLYKAVRDNDRDLAVYAYETWGFDIPNNEVLEVLNQWARYIYTPLLEDKTRRIHDTDSGAYGAGVAAKVHRELNRLGGIMPPREFVLVDRAAIGLGSVFMRIKAEVNWYRLFHNLIDDFDEVALAKRQKEALCKVGLIGE
ncbi:MAG: AarF/ABC1/UbiB kinase family protein [Magnetovibrio sp.]|nr:AarF/ABC1/UbiB kinase family protein [Magnetovibrio sp.]